jgi:hypothetical protein
MLLSPKENQRLFLSGMKKWKKKKKQKNSLKMLEVCHRSSLFVGMPLFAIIQSVTPLSLLALSY